MKCLLTILYTICCLLIFSCNGASKSADTSVSETQKVEASRPEPTKQEEAKPFVIFEEQDTVFLLDLKPDTIIHIDCKTIYKETKHSRWHVMKLNMPKDEFEILHNPDYLPKVEGGNGLFSRL